MAQLFTAVLLAAVIHHECTSIRAFFQPKSELAPCQQQRRVGPSGKITSPGYPLFYSNHTSCSWDIIGRVGQVITIRVRDPYRGVLPHPVIVGWILVGSCRLAVEIHLQAFGYAYSFGHSFDDLNLGGPADCETTACCGGTWIKLGPTPTGGEKVYCGKTVPEPFLSTTSEVWIKFHTSPLQVPRGRGFQLSYTVGGFTQQSCRPDEFQCLNGKCVLLHWACNGHMECEDNSDELYCDCPEGWLRCATGTGCYSRSGRCNGQADCPDFSDELDCTFCGPNRTLCSPTSTTCYDPLNERCDNIFHCENGEDEQGCMSGCERKIMCASGVGCYRAPDRCDGVPHCVDHSDEIGCGPDKCRSERGAYLCGDGRCVPEDSVCDRVSDCPDGSDEYGCLHNSMITAAIIGSLFFGLLVVVAVSCSCRLYALRLAAQRQEAAGVLSDSPPHFADGAAADFWFREPPPPYAVAVGEHRYPLPPESVIVYGGGAQTDITGMCGITRSSQRRPRRVRRHRRRPPSPTTTSSTSHDAGSSEEALHPPSQFENSVVLSVNPAASSRRKVSADSVHSDEGGRRVVSIAMAMDAAVSCDDTRPLIDDDRCPN